MTTNPATIRTNRTGTVESAHGIAVHHRTLPDAPNLASALKREIASLLADANRTHDATHAERCRETARELYALRNLTLAIAARVR